MVIQDLKPSRRVEGRWLAVLEDGSILRLGEGEVVDFALYAGKELSEGEAEALTQAARRSGLRQKALNLLTSKPMSRRELEQKLRSWEAGEEEAAAIADRMKELGFLNDAAYAAQVVRYYSAKGYGERKLRDELYRRGIPRELWDESGRYESVGKELLRFTDRSIEAVAQECGLNDANYFSRMFKRVEGISPGEYRRQW